MELRPYQQDLYVKTATAFKQGYHRVLVVSPCGSGKTMLMAHMATETAKRNKTVWVILPRQEIFEQFVETLGLFDKTDGYIYVGMAITTANRVRELPKPDLIIFDECHISVANTYWKIVNAAPSAYIVGCTASPIRSDNKPLGALYETLIEGVTVRWLIDNKYLSPYKYFSVTVADLSAINNYENGEADIALMKPAVYGKVIDNWKRFAGNMQTVVYATSVKHSLETAKTFRENGIKAEHFDGSTPRAERAELVNRFRKGEIQVLCNCDLISMGFDMPDIGCVVMLRPTDSCSLYIQQSGRALRYKPNKTAVILDMVANYQRFQMPDEPYEWSLDKPIKKQRELNENGDFYIRSCPECFMTFKTALVCPFCGAEYPLHPREIKAREEVELQRITAEETARVEEEKKKARREQGRADSFEALVQLGKERGYKNPAFWAAQVMRGRRK